MSDGSAFLTLFCDLRLETSPCVNTLNGDEQRKNSLMGEQPAAVNSDPLTHNTDEAVKHFPPKEAVTCLVVEGRSLLVKFTRKILTEEVD